MRRGLLAAAVLGAVLVADATARDSASVTIAITLSRTWSWQSDAPSGCPAGGRGEGRQVVRLWTERPMRARDVGSVRVRGLVGTRERGGYFETATAHTPDVCEVAHGDCFVNRARIVDGSVHLRVRSGVMTLSGLRYRVARGRRGCAPEVDEVRAADRTHPRVEEASARIREARVKRVSAEATHTVTFTGSVRGRVTERVWWRADFSR